MTPPPTALHVSPHPDDEVLGAGATLIALRLAGWRVVNLTCSLGRPGDEARRRGELAAALDMLGFESVVADPPVAVGRGADHEAGEVRIASLVVELVGLTTAELVVSPDPEDAHHAHATVGRAVAAAHAHAIASSGGDSAAAHAPPPAPRRWWAWSLWRDLERPTLYVPWGAERLGELTRALDCHRGELARNDYRDVLAARGRLQAVLGSERVFGFGTGPAAAEPYADLLTERVRDGRSWRTGEPRVLDASAGWTDAPATRTGGG